VHPRATLGTIGSALAAAKLKGFDDTQMRHAINMAATMAMTTNRQAMLDVARIRRIDVRAFQMAALLSGRRITTSFGAKFSIPFALSTILVHGRSTIECFGLADLPWKDTLQER
jgi:2-methylcitrate dehydratase PrpD